MTTALNKGLSHLEIPDRVLRLPRDHRGFPIPWFVHSVGGKPDFRIIGPGRVERAMALNLCWICGTTLARHKTFVVGPMCAINRISSEPPSHRGCAMFAARACPFLTRPKMVRNETDLPADLVQAAGNMVLHNPGVVAVWIARDYRPVPVDSGILLRLGEPEEVRWLAYGLPATRGEVLVAIEKGLPFLLDEARRSGPDAVAALLHQVETARQYLPMDNGYAVKPQAAAERVQEEHRRAG